MEPVTNRMYTKQRQKSTNQSEDRNSEQTKALAIIEI